jgi:DNA-binding response OmpR family regulator
MERQGGVWIMAQILVIDDEEIVRITFRDILERAGHEVEEAADGEQAIIAQRNNPADIIIADIIMPKKEGIETIMELRQEFPSVPIIGISGGGHIPAEECLYMARRAGAEYTFIKPVSPQELLSAITALS